MTPFRSQRRDSDSHLGEAGNRSSRRYSVKSCVCHRAQEQNVCFVGKQKGGRQRANNEPVEHVRGKHHSKILEGPVQTPPLGA